jgi:hypothetical protein
MLKGFRIILLLLLTGLLLAGCQSATITTPPSPGAAPVIPTFTPAPATALPVPTITPTPIIVLPTATEPPTATPAPPPTATAAPTTTPFPSPAPLPTLALPALSAQAAYREISPEQARNLNGYRALLPDYLPAGFKLGRISFSEIPGSKIISLVTEFDGANSQTFYLNAQYFPAATPSPAPTPTGSPLLTPAPTSTLPPQRTGPFPSAAPGIFQQETVRVRGQAGLLSYTNQFTSLSWTESPTSYALNGMITPDEALKVAESLR